MARKNAYSLTKATEDRETKVSNPFYKGESSVDNSDCVQFYENILFNLVTLYQPANLLKLESWLLPHGQTPKRFAFGQTKDRRDIPNADGSISTEYVSTNKVNLNPEFSWARDWVMQFDHSTLNPEFQTNDLDKRSLARGMNEFAKNVWREKGMPMKTENALQQAVYGGEFIFFRDPDTNEVEVFNFFNYFPYPSLNINDEARRAPYCACCRLVYLEEAILLYKKSFPDEITDDMTQDEIYDKLGGPRGQLYNSLISNRIMPERLIYDINFSKVDQETREALQSMFPSHASMFSGQQYKNQPMIPIYSVYHLGTREKATFIDAKLISIDSYTHGKIPFYTLAPVTDGLTCRGISPLENAIVYSRLKYNLINLELDNALKQNSSNILLNKEYFPNGLPLTFDTFLVETEANMSLGNIAMPLAKPNSNQAQALMNLRMSLLDEEINAMGLTRTIAGLPTTNYNSRGEVEKMQQSASQSVAKINAKLQTVLYPEILTDLVQYEVEHLASTKSLVIKEPGGDSNILILPEKELQITDKKDGEEQDYYIYTLKWNKREAVFYKDKVGIQTLFKIFDKKEHERKTLDKQNKMGRDTEEAVKQILSGESEEESIESKEFKENFKAKEYLAEIMYNYDKPQYSWDDFKSDVRIETVNSNFRISDIFGIAELKDLDYQFVVSMVQGTQAENAQKMQAMQAIFPVTMAESILTNPLAMGMLDQYLRLGGLWRIDEIVPKGEIERVAREKKQMQEATIAAQSKNPVPNIPAPANPEQGAGQDIMAMLSGATPGQMPQVGVQAGTAPMTPISQPTADTGAMPASPQAQPLPGDNFNNQQLQQDPLLAQEQGMNPNNQALQAMA